MRNADLDTENAAYNHYSNFNSFSTKIANLCLLFFNLRKGRLHYIRHVGRLVSPLIFILLYDRLDKKKTKVGIEIRDLHLV